MRKLFILLLLPALAKAQPNPKEFKLTVKLQSIKMGEKLYLEYTNNLDPNNPQITDSILFVQDSLVFKGMINEPGAARLFRFKKSRVDTASMLKLVKELPLPEDQKSQMTEYFLNPIKEESYDIFLMPGETTIQLSPNFQTAKVEGPKPVTDFEQMKKDEKEYMEMHFNMEDLQDMGDLTDMEKGPSEKMMKKVDSVNRMKNDAVYLSYIRTNPTSPLALYALQKGMPPRVDSADKYISLLSTLSPEIQQWSSAKKLLDILKAAKNAEIGSLVADFQQFDSLGRIVNFSSFKGKYVLIEFWASWCGPCRMKNPELVNTYDKYSKEKFTILGVALEEKDAKEKWLKAIAKDKLKWPQVTDFKYWDNAVAKQFGILAIPFNLLVDPTGKIVGKNLWGEDLDNRLAEIFNNKRGF